MKTVFKKTFALFAAAMTAGLFAISPFTVSAEELRNGDTNGDGKVDLHDAVNVCKHILKTNKLAGTDLELADYNKDGKVDLHDAVFIARRILFDKRINDVVALINSKRKASGITPLTINMALVDASMKRASELPKKFSGDLRPDNSNFSTVLTEYSIAYEKCENCVAAVPATPKDLFDAMVEKSDIMNMLLNKEYTEIGVGYCLYNDRYKNYWAILLI